MELRHLRYFSAVAEAQSFSKAARRLGIKQPPLSKQIRQLELEVGTVLFHRLPRGAALTDAGRVYLEDVGEILGRVQLATQHAQRVARGVLGRIRVGMINSAPFHPFVPRVIRQFGQRYPQVALSLEEASTPALALAMLDGSIDVAFVRPLLGEEPKLVLETLFDEEMVVALPEGHVLAGAGTLKLEWLANEDFVLFSRTIGSGLYDEIISACQRAKFSPRISHEVLHVSSIANLVAAGLGVSVVPASMQQVHAAGVVYRPIMGDAPKASMTLACRKDDPSMAVQNMVRLARQQKRPASTASPRRGSDRRQNP